MDNPIVVSIIITGLNVEKTINRTLDSLVKQSFPQDMYEIIYVDAGSTDNTLRIIKSWVSSFNNIKVIVAKGVSPGEGRNIGARYARGKLLAFIDADCIAKDDWLYKLVTTYEELKKRYAKVGAVGATLVDDKVSPKIKTPHQKKY